MAIAAIYIDADTFTVATDRTVEFCVGRRVKCNCGVDGDNIGTIISSSYSDPNTTVNLSSGSDNLTANLVDVDYGIQSEGSSGSVPIHAHQGDEGDGGYISELAASDGSPSPALSVDSAGNITTVQNLRIIDTVITSSYVFINYHGSGNRYAYIDFAGDDTNTDSFRIIRANTGVNATSQLRHKGTGIFSLVAIDAANVDFYTNSVKRVEITGNGRLIIYSNILTTQYQYSGKTLNVTVDDASTTFGHPLYCAADFHYERCDADAIATMPCRVMAVQNGAGSKIVLLEGQICNTSWTWVAGDIYVSTVTGGMTQTAPSGSGDQVQRIGWALSADTIYFRPDSTVVEIV